MLKEVNIIYLVSNTALHCLTENPNKYLKDNYLKIPTRQWNIFSFTFEFTASNMFTSVGATNTINTCEENLTAERTVERNTA